MLVAENSSSPLRIREARVESVQCRLPPTNGETDIELKGGARYIVLIMIPEFFECLALIAQLVPFVAIIMSFFL